MFARDCQYLVGRLKDLARADSEPSKRPVADARVIKRVCHIERREPACLGHCLFIAASAPDPHGQGRATPDSSTLSRKRMGPLATG